MRNKIKGWSLTFGAIASITTPVVAVISCGTETKKIRPTAVTAITGKDNTGEETQAPAEVHVSDSYKEVGANSDLAGNGLTTDYEAVSKDSEEEGKTFENFQNYRTEGKEKIKALKNILISQQASDPIVVAKAIITRYIGEERAKDFTFEKIDKKTLPGELPIKDGSKVMEDHTFNKYTFEVTAEHQVHIKGSSAVAMARGWYDWMKRNGYGMIGWEANSIHLPAKSHFKVTPETEVVSPYERHYFGNSAAAGYSSPWWNDNDWANWLSWCAVHGYDLMLDYVGHEQILTRLFQEIGYTKDNVRKYLSGPAYATWSRLGNIANWDSIPDNDTFDAWSRKRIEVQHKIKKMMGNMDIKGIPASFAGFVPEVQNGVTQSFESLFGAPEPDYFLPNPANGGETTHTSTYTQRTHWTSEDRHHNHLLNPDWKPTEKNPLKDAMGNDKKSTGYDTSVSLFENMSKRYVELYQQEFGESDYYLADAFEEMFVPAGTNKPDYFNKVGNALYGGIEAATRNNKNGTAVFAFQGWNLGFQRGDWNPTNLNGFLKDIPDNKVFIIDQAEDYNEWSWHNNANWKYYKDNRFGEGQSFGGKKWVYSTIPNMGGNTSITGPLEWYGTAGPDALKDSKHGYLFAYGTAPEGIDNNPVTQELIADMGWRTEAIDIKNDVLEGYAGGNWLANYDINRYGFESKKLREYWIRRLGTANSYLDDHPIHKWQLGGWSTWTAPDSDGWLMALQTFKEVAEERKDLKNTPLFRDDLLRFTNIYLGVILDRKLSEFQATANIAKKRELKEQCDAIFTKMDKLTATHNTDRLERWLEKARWWGDTEAQSDYFERDAKYHITLWYPPLQDYASKHWGGLLGGYYKKKMDFLMDRDLEGGVSESAAERAIPYQSSWNPNGNDAAAVPKAEFPFIFTPLSKEVLSPTAFNQPYSEAIQAMDKYSIVQKHGLTPIYYSTLMSATSQQHLRDIKTEFNVTTEQLQNLKSLTIFSQVVPDYQANYQPGNPSIQNIEIIAGTDVIWRHRNVGAALTRTPGNADALTLNLEGLPQRVASNSNNGAIIRITWSATMFTNAKLQVFMNDVIDESNEDKRINGAKTYRTWNNGNPLSNEIRFNENGDIIHVEQLPQVAITEPDRMSLINADGTVNQAAAAARHLTIVPVAVGKKDQNEWVTTVYRATTDEHHELANGGILTLDKGSVRSGTFVAAKSFWHKPAPTVEQLKGGPAIAPAQAAVNEIIATLDKAMEALIDKQDPQTNEAYQIAKGRLTGLAHGDVRDVNQARAEIIKSVQDRIDASNSKHAAEAKALKDAKNNAIAALNAIVFSFSDDPDKFALIGPANKIVEEAQKSINQATNIAKVTELTETYKAKLNELDGAPEGQSASSASNEAASQTGDQLAPPEPNPAANTDHPVPSMSLEAAKHAAVQAISNAYIAANRPLDGIPVQMSAAKEFATATTVEQVNAIRDKYVAQATQSNAGSDTQSAEHTYR